ncbi:MAG TPA: aspartyl protease family protein [Anaeromyxobacter sp.]|nr:aspartyl protease family protein [Anaeromyxobacter sp.]
MTSRAFSLAALAALALSAGAEEPTPAETLERARRAQGAEAWEEVRTLHLEGRMRQGGVEGTVRSDVDVVGGRYREEWQLGPIRGAEGWDGERAWRQDTSGLAWVEGAAEVRQGIVSGAYRRAQGIWSKARAPASIRSLGARREGEEAFQVLSITPAGGRPFELWVGADGLFGRVVETEQGRSVTTILSDWREVSGVMLPFSAVKTGASGRSEGDRRIGWTTATVNGPLSDADFALPAPPSDSGLVREKRETTVPAYGLRAGVPCVDVKLNGKGPFRLVLDTGGMNVVTPALARLLGLEPEGRFAVAGVGEATEDVAVAKVRLVEVGEAFVQNQIFLVYPLDRLAFATSVPVQGMLGYELFQRFGVRIDYAGPAVTLYAPDAFRYDGPGAVVPFVFNGRTPQVEGEIDGIPGTFLIDTGSDGALDIVAPFVRAHDLLARYGARSEQIRTGVGGLLREYSVRAGALRLGPIEIPTPAAGLAMTNAGALARPGVAGYVGSGLLSRFTVLLDYAHQELVLERNPEFGDIRDRTGLGLQAAGGAFEVVEVVPGSPAAEAGMEVGDRITFVDSSAAGALSLRGLRAILRERPAGSVLRLEWWRLGREHRVRIVLREPV